MSALLAVIAAMFVMMPMVPHAVAAMAPPCEHNQGHDEQHGKERKEEMMRVRMKRIGRVGTGIETMRPEHPNDCRNDQRKHRHAGQKMQDPMPAPMTPSSPALFLVLGRWGIGGSGFIDGKFLADANAEFGHVSSSD